MNKQQYRALGLALGTVVVAVLVVLPLLRLLLRLLLQMLNFDESTRAKLMQLSPWFRFKVICWFLLVRHHLGIELWIVSGLRTAQEQTALHAQDKKNPLPVPGRPDVHMLGLAVDVNGKVNGKNTLLKTSSWSKWEPVMALAAQCGIKRIGHFFSNHDDRNHVDDGGPVTAAMVAGVAKLHNFSVNG